MGRSTGTENSSIGTRAPRHTSNGPVGEPATRNRAGDAKHFAESQGLSVSTPEKRGCVAGALASCSQRRLCLSQISRIHSGQPFGSVYRDGLVAPYASTCRYLAASGEGSKPSCTCEVSG